MRTLLRHIFIVTIYMGSLGIYAQQTAAPVLEPSPLTAEDISLYHSFLAFYNNGSQSMLNIANATKPFTPNYGDEAGCLKDFAVTHTSLVHHFPSGAFADLNTHLVDPHLHQKRDPGDAIRKGESVDDAVAAGFRAGIFTFSEIIFNAGHDRAAFTYSFVCGGLCGHGGTVIYRKTNGKWVREKDNCGNWIS
jgi:hypothetical protein